MTSVAIYLRISEDREGNQTATERQREDCARYAESRGWELLDVFEDVDLSAYKRTVRRPEFERMIEAVRTKAVDGVLAWKIDRISRRQRDLVRLDEACEEAGGFIATVVDQIDTRQPTGRFVAELLVAQARMESENASTRVKRKHAELAKLGHTNGGGTRAFGYTADRKHVDPDEAALIREAASRVLAGEGVRAICLDFERRGVKTPAGNAWTQHTLRRMLMRSLLSGQREHEGRLTPGTWPAILEPAETERLRAVLLNPARRTTNGTPRRYLLTGFLRCGRCGHELSARPRGDRARRYVCARQPNRPNCGKLARLAEPVEDFVKQAVLIALDGVDLREHIDRADVGVDDGLVRTIRDDEAALEELSRDYYGDRAISRAEYFAARDAISTRLDFNRRGLAQRQTRNMLAQVVGAGEEIARRWDDESLDWKRAVIGTVVDHVVLEPARKGYNRFDPALVRIVWRF